MTTTLDLVAAELAAADAARPRSLQVESGASSVLSCRAKLLLRTTGAVPTDERTSLATLWGSAIHWACEQSAGAGQTVEQAFTYRGVRCTIDRYDGERRVLTDLKTLASPEKVADTKARGPKRNHILQVHLGAAAVIAGGLEVDTVELLFLPRSGGTMADAWLWSEPFNPKLADEAADWLLAERFRAENFASPATAADLHGLRDEGFFFCSSFCEYLTLCRGVQAEPSEDDLSDAAGRLAGAKAREAAAKAEKTEATKELYGFTGTAGPWKVRTVSDTSTVRLDIEAVEARADEWKFVTGEDLPTKESVRRGYVTVSKARA